MKRLIVEQESTELRLMYVFQIEEVGIVAVFRSPNFDILVQSTGGQDRHARMRLQTIDLTPNTTVQLSNMTVKKNGEKNPFEYHAVLVSRKTLNNGARVFVPEKYVAAVGSRNDEFTARSVEVDALDGGIVAMAPVAVQGVGRIRKERRKQVDILVVVAGQNFRPVEVVNGASDVSTDRRIQLQRQRQRLRKSQNKTKKARK